MSRASISSFEGRRVLLDTNVLLDYYLPARPGSEGSFRAIARALDAGAVLLYAGHGCVDLFYLLVQFQKSALRGEGLEVTEKKALAINEYAWGCIENLGQIADPVPLDTRTIWLARRFKSVGKDFEDDMVLASCELGEVDLLLTRDRDLILKAHLAALSPEDFIAHLECGA